MEYKLTSNCDENNYGNYIVFWFQVRTEMLHNIEPVQNGWALRVGDMKLVFAERGYTQLYPLWYGPHGPVDNTSSINQNTTVNIPKHLQKGRLDSVLENIHRKPQKPRPYNVQCGEKPENASTNCKVTEAPCLFNVTADPCEYRNIADDFPDVVSELLVRLSEYNATAVPVRSVGTDPAAFPRHHGGFWVPWIELDPDQNEVQTP